VVVEETKGPEVTEEEELADPAVVESDEETYLKEFAADGSLQDTAMKEAGGDWIRMSNVHGKEEEVRKDEVRGGPGA
jgi:hypothetical protein